jgi:Cellulose binding domain
LAWDNSIQFGGEVTITNLGPTVTDWNVTWTVPASQVTDGSWNVEVRQAAQTVTATPYPWVATLNSGASLTFGYYAVDRGPRQEPVFRLNGNICANA